MDLRPEWVVGFVDGEGCFHVDIQPHPELNVGYQVLPEFIVVQHSRDRQILFALKRFFGAGTVRKNHGDRDCLRIRKLDALDQVCEFFLKHSLKTVKNVEFRKFRRIVNLMQQKRHLESDGLLEIIGVALQMNSQQRSALEEIKRQLQNIG